MIIVLTQTLTPRSTHPPPPTQTPPVVVVVNDGRRMRITGHLVKEEGSYWEEPFSQTDFMDSFSGFKDKTAKLACRHNLMLRLKGINGLIYGSLAAYLQNSGHLSADQRLFT